MPDWAWNKAGKAKNMRDIRSETGWNTGLFRVVPETKTLFSKKLGRRNKVKQSLFSGKWNTGLGSLIGSFMHETGPLPHFSSPHFGSIICLMRIMDMGEVWLGLWKMAWWSLGLWGFGLECPSVSWSSVSWSSSCTALRITAHRITALRVTALGVLDLRALGLHYQKFKSWAEFWAFNDVGGLHPFSGSVGWQCSFAIRSVWGFLKRPASRSVPSGPFCLCPDQDQGFRQCGF